MQTKKELRNHILKKRSQLSTTEVTDRSKIICNHIEKHYLYRNAQNICLYMPIRNEVDVRYLIDISIASEKKIWLPKVIDNEMEFYSYDKTTALIAGRYNILEPESQLKLIPDEKTLIIMPGAVFSKAGDRIGYGGGYYDRYLQRNPKCHTAAVCYEFQLLQTIPTEEHDIKPQTIISDYKTR